jgi:demethylmenaquinone methyltransferase/2-methoxy-6-polyprenyl-1,4-benzoquinol methylase
MNRLLSFGLDKRWRRHLLDALGDVRPGDAVLDVATGTADVALAIAASGTRRRRSWSAWTPPRACWRSARARSPASDVTGGSAWWPATVKRCPLVTGEFAATTIAFGIRNVPDRLAALASSGG